MPYRKTVRYQHNYSREFPSIKDEDERELKARKIIACLRFFFGRESFDGKICLDLGSSVGIITRAVAAQGAETIGIDIDWEALNLSSKRRTEKLIGLVMGDGGLTPFKPCQFDLVICSQVYEHMPDIDILIAEIYRLLKPHGCCFFSGPNKFAIIEEHYNLPLLSWLPRKIAHMCVRLMRKGDEYYEKPLSYKLLRQKLGRFTIYDFTKPLLCKPDLFYMTKEVGKMAAIFKVMPPFTWYFIERMVPNFNWMLVKDVQPGVDGEA